MADGTILETAKLSKVSLGIVSSEFSKLVKEGLVGLKIEGQGKFYKLNLANPRTRKLCELFETDKRERLFKENRRLAWILEDFTKKVAEFIPEAQTIVLFGSAARGETTLRSDIDLLVLTADSQEQYFKKLMDSIDKLAREISGRHPAKLVPVAMAMKDFEKSVKDKKRFAVDVLNDGVVLFGGERYYLLLSRVI